MKLKEKLAAIEREVISECFLRYKGNISKTVLETGYDKGTIRTRIMKYGLWQSGTGSAGIKGEPTTLAINLMNKGSKYAQVFVGSERDHNDWLC